MVEKLRRFVVLNWKFLLVAAALFAAALWLFWPATGYDFLNFDDDRYISGNLAVTRGLTISSLRWAFTTVYEDWWLPLLWLSYMVDTELFGTGPFGYHLTNILLHAINASILFWALSRMTGARWRSAFVAALFAFHPLRVESVAWVAERKDVLSGLFFLLGLLAYRRYVEKPLRSRLWLLPLLMLLGLMSKGIMIVFPFVLLLLDYWPLQRATALWGREAWTQWRPLLREKIPLFALTLIFVLINLSTHSAASPVFNPLPFVDRLGLIFPNYWAYLHQIFWPVQLAILHPANDVVHWPTSIAALIGLVALTGLAWSQRAKRPYLLVGWLWFLLILFPVIRGVRYSLASFADRFTYLPSIGLAMACVWCVADLVPRWCRRPVLLAPLALAILAACAWQTRATLPLWKNTMAAFGNVLKLAPDHPLSNNNFGEYLLELGQPERALGHFEKAIVGSVQTTTFYSNLGLALLLLNRPDEAILRMEAMRLKYKPDCEFLNFVTALAWMEKNNPEKAISYFKRALAASSFRPTWQAELARAYREAGQMQAYSNELARIGAEGFPNLANYDGLCLYYLHLWQNGHGRRAWTFFQRELEKSPDNIPLLNNAAWFLATDPPVGVELGEALRLAQKAHERGGDAHPDILDTLAVAHAANGQFADAIHWAEEAQALAQSQGQRTLAANIDLRLRAYRSGKAWGKDGPVE